MAVPTAQGADEVGGGQSRAVFVDWSPYFSVRLSRSSTLPYGQPPRMSIKITSGAGVGLEGSLHWAYMGRGRRKELI